jgi:hypothetical protein
VPGWKVDVDCKADVGYDEGDKRAYDEDVLHRIITSRKIDERL